MEDTNKLTHYIGMNGSHGYMPDSCNAYETLEGAASSLQDLLELTDEQHAELIETGSVECTPDQGAEYCEITECTCHKPWEHAEMDEPSDWPEYARFHVLEFLDTLDKVTYSEHVRISAEECPKCMRLPNPSQCDEHSYWEDKTFYCLPYASFGDYDNSSAVERSNSRIFDELPYVSLRHGDFYSVQTGIDQDDIGDITFEQLEELKDMCNGLADYPVLDEDDMCKVEMELQDEAWDSWAKSDFRRELVKLFGDVYEDFIDAIEDGELVTLFLEASEASNTYWEIEAGGSAHIDLERVAKAVTLDLPAFCAECYAYASETVLLHPAIEGEQLCEACKGSPVPDYTNQKPLFKEPCGMCCGRGHYPIGTVCPQCNGKRWLNE